MASNFTNLTFSTTGDDFYESTEFITSTTESGLELLGYDITGLELMLFYMVLNIIILFIILILACRSGAQKAKEEKEKKRNEQKKREQDQIDANNNNNNNNGDGVKPFEIQLAMKRGDRANSVHSEPPSEYDHERKEDIMLNLHDKVSSFGRVKSAKVCCGACVADIMNRSFIYSAFLVHVWDQGSDLGVIYTWFTEDDGKWKYLGWIAIGIMINYRLFSAYSLRKAQRGWRDTILQVLDVQLFVDVFRSFEDVKPTDSLYWIRAMEAVLESCLQILLQFVYLYQETDILVWLSLFGSLASVIFSLLHYTDVIFVFEDPDDALTMCQSIWLNIKWYIGYLSRFLFRLCEVTSRCMVLALIWSTWNSEDQSDLTGLYIVGCIMGLEGIFYAFLTQFRIPPWEIAAFLVVNIDLTLTFEGRVGALTKPLKHNPFYVCICKPVAEMFTHITHSTEQYYEDTHLRTGTHINKKHKLQPWNDKNMKHIKEHQEDIGRQKLLIAPAHYVYRFLESVFQLFCVLTYAVIDNSIYVRLFENNTWTVAIATATTILTPILYCTVRSFADESKTLERNLIAMVHHDNETREIIKLIGAGASLTQTDYEGNNIVHACVVKNNDQLLRRLIKKYKKSKKRVDLNGANKKGFTPALLAAKCGSIDCLKLLVEHIDFNQTHPMTQQAMIHIATEFDQHELIEYLCSLGEDKCSIKAKYTYITPNGNEITDYNAIHVATRHNSVLSLDILIAKGVEFRGDKAVLSNGDTAAIIAASRGHTIILQKLYDAGDFLDIQGNFGHTPLYRAALNNHPATVLVLGRDFHANANILDENGVHIVVQAFKSRNFGVLSSLATLGCRFDGVGKWLEVEIENKGHHDDKLTPLMWACKYNYPKLVKTLLDSGADKNHMNKLDETASHHAAAMGSLDCIKILYQFNANLRLLNGAGQSPKEKAIQHNQRDIINWFNALEKHNK